jgi:CO/xanthine dehydrogenase Mo-binding subunit
MTDLSPAAHAVLAAVTLTEYDVPPEGMPAFAERMAPLIAAALRAAAAEIIEEVSPVEALLALATELEGQ